MEGTVTVFSRSTCARCDATLALLSTKPVTVRVVKLDADPKHEDALRQLLNDLSDGAQTVPQIFFNSTLIKGGNANLYALERDGQLDDLMHAMLTSKSVLPTPADRADIITAIHEECTAATRSLDG